MQHLSHIKPGRAFNYLDFLTTGRNKYQMKVSHGKEFDYKVNNDMKRIIDFATYQIAVLSTNAFRIVICVEESSNK